MGNCFHCSLLNLLLHFPHIARKEKKGEEKKKRIAKAQAFKDESKKRLSYWILNSKDTFTRELSNETWC